MRANMTWLSTVSAGLLAVLAASQAGAQLYAADNLTDNSLHGVVQFNNNLAVTGSFTTSGTVAGLATDGTNVFASLPTGITQFTTGGTTVRSYANIGVDRFGALALAGNTLLAADNLTDNSLYGVILLNSTLNVIGSFTTTTAIAGLATDGTNIFASLTTGVLEYSMSGTVVRSYDNI